MYALDAVDAVNEVGVAQIGLLALKASTAWG